MQACTLSTVHLFFLPYCICLVSIVLFMLRAYCCFCEAAPLLLWCVAKPLQHLPWCVYIKWMQLITDVAESVGWLCGQKKGPARNHERDIVQYGPYSAFVDKWISMLIKSDSDMSENCGECGIILTARPYTWTTVVSSVCGLSLSCSKRFYLGVRFNLEQYALFHRCASCMELHPCGKILINAHFCIKTSGIYGFILLFGDLILCFNRFSPIFNKAETS